jgi:hypothetical protein
MNQQEIKGAVRTAAARWEPSDAYLLHGAVRIGQGTKMHPAIKSAQYGLLICCRCPGTQQGAAYHKAQFFAGMASNCRN